MEDKKKELLEEYTKYAEEKGIALNPNKKMVEAVIEGIINHEINDGARYCPCRKLTGDKEEDAKIACPCIYHLDEVAKMGHCHCNLFVKK